MSSLSPQLKVYILQLDMQLLAATQTLQAIVQYTEENNEPLFDISSLLDLLRFLQKLQKDLENLTGVQ